MCDLWLGVMHMCWHTHAHRTGPGAEECRLQVFDNINWDEDFSTI
jgi:hypothetical protein